MERLEATIGVFLLMFGAAGAWDQLMLIKYLDDEGQIQKARTKVVYLYTPMIAIAFVFLAIGFRFGS